MRCNDLALRTDVIFAAVLAAASLAVAQTSAPSMTERSPEASVLTPATRPAAPAALPSLMPTTAPATAPAAAGAFVGIVTADRVNVRPGPGAQYYALGSLAKNETVQVMGAQESWYKILPPKGIYCLIAKEFVETGPDNETGTVKRDYIRVRAGSTINPNRSDAVLTIVRSGTKVTILGSADVGGTKFYKIAPPEKAYVYVSAQYVRKAPEGTVYTPPVAAGRGGATSRPASTEVAVEVSPPPGTETRPPTTATVVNVEPTTQRVVVAPQPAKEFPAGVFQKHSELAKKTSNELEKPLEQRNAAGLLDEWQALAKTADLPPSVKRSAQLHIEALERNVAMQKLAREVAAEDASATAARKARDEELAAAMKRLEDAARTGPYLAEGVLETSPTVKGKYALVDPITRRVKAYVDPAAEVDLSKLLGQYIGVRGTWISAKDAGIKVIRVNNATMMPAPKME